MIPGSKMQWMPNLFISQHQLSSEHPLAMGCEESNIIHWSWCPALLWAALPGLLWPSGPGKSPVFSSLGNWHHSCAGKLTLSGSSAGVLPSVLPSVTLPRQAGPNDAPPSCLPLQEPLHCSQDQYAEWPASRDAHTANGPPRLPTPISSFS